MIHQMGTGKPTPVGRPGEGPDSPAKTGPVTSTSLLNGERFADKSPTQIYATLLAEGIYLCAVSTMYADPGEELPGKDRRRQARHPPRAVPELQATAPGQVFF
jgi:putative transposase